MDTGQVVKTTDEIPWTLGPTETSNIKFAPEQTGPKTTEDIRWDLPGLEKKPGLGYIVGETIRSTGEQILEPAKALYQPVLGSLSQRAVGIGKGALEQLYKFWKSGGREGSWEDAKATADETTQQLAELYSPKTELGKKVAEIAGPIEIAATGGLPALAGVAGITAGTEALPSIAKTVTKDPEKQAAIEFLGEIAVFAMAPKIMGKAGRLVKSYVEAKKPIPWKQIRIQINGSKAPTGEILETNKHLERLEQMEPPSAKMEEQVPQTPPIVPPKEVPGERTMRLRKAIEKGEVEKPTEVPVVDIVPKPEGGWTIKFDLPKSPERPKPTPEMEITPEMIAEQKALRRVETPTPTIQAVPGATGEAIPPTPPIPLPVKPTMPKKGFPEGYVPPVDVHKEFGVPMWEGQTYEQKRALESEVRKEADRRKTAQAKSQFSKKLTENEYYREQEEILQTESKILEATGRTEKDVNTFIENTFMDGEELRKIVNHVRMGRIPLEEAVKEVKYLIDSTVRPGEAGEAPAGLKTDLFERIEEPEKVAAPAKPEQGKLLDLETRERVVFDRRGLSSFDDINTWRKKVQSFVDEGYVIEYTTQAGAKGTGRILEKKSVGEGRLISKAKAPEFGGEVKPEGLPLEPEMPKAEPAINQKLVELYDRIKVPDDMRSEITPTVLRNYNEAMGPLENYVRNTWRLMKKAKEKEGMGIERAKKRQQTEEFRTEAKQVEETTPETELIRKEFETKVKSVMERVVKDDIDRKIIEDIAEFPQAEIARRLGMKRQSVGERVVAIRKRLLADPEGREALKYLDDKKYTELNLGVPFTSEVAKAIKSVRQRIKEDRTIRREEIRQELQKTDAGKVEWMYLETERLLKEKRDPTIQKARRAAVHALVDTSGNIKREILNKLGSQGREAIMNHDLVAGASSKSERIYNEAEKTIYKGLSKDDEFMLNKAIQSRRTIAIDDYKAKAKPKDAMLFEEEGITEPEIQHPHGLTQKEHREFMKKVPKEINDKADAYFAEMKKSLDDLHDNGLLTDEAYEALKSRGDYSPRWFIQYIDPDISYTTTGGKIITVPSSGIKRLKTGDINVMEIDSRSLLKGVIGRTQGRIFRNKANLAAWDIAEKFPGNGIWEKVEVVRETKAGKPVYQPAPGGFSKIKVMKDGVAHEMLMPNKFAQEWSVKDPLVDSQLANIVGSVSGARLLRAMATGINPEFAIRNMPRDIAHVWITTDEYSSFLPKAGAQMAKDYATVMKDTFLRKGRWRDYIDEGGGMDFLTNQGSITKVHGHLHSLQDVLGYVGETSEIWTRLALRERAIKNGKSPTEATWIARNYMDFGQGGNVIKAIDVGVPYLNAATQATRGIFRAFKDRPVDTIFKFAQIGTLASGLYLANRYMNRDCWDHVTDREKANNFIITTPFSWTDDSGNKRYLYFKIAKDQGQKVVATLFENLMAKSLGEKVDADQMILSFNDFLPIVPTELVPPTMEALFGYVLNKDFWLREDIWKGPKVAPREEYTRYTHPGLVKAGELTGLSPERLDTALAQWFTRGNIYTSLVSGGFSLAFSDLNKSDRDKMATEVVQQLPFIRQVLKSTPRYEERAVKEENKLEKEAATQRYKENRDFDTIVGKYYQKKTPEGLAEIKKFIREAPAEDRKRLMERLEFSRATHKLPDRTWWLGLMGNPPETRANIFWVKYERGTPEKKKEMMLLVKTVPGIWSDRFAKKLASLIRKANKEENE